MEPLLQFFAFGHLPEQLRDVSKPYSEMAHSLVSMLPRNPERTVALRKLLESRDSALRAMLFRDQSGDSYESPFRKPNMSASSGMGIPKS